MSPSVQVFHLVEEFPEDVAVHPSLERTTGDSSAHQQRTSLPIPRILSRKEQKKMRKKCKKNWKLPTGQSFGVASLKAVTGKEKNFCGDLRKRGSSILIRVIISHNTTPFCK
jgi:hypothetical protein